MTTMRREVRLDRAARRPRPERGPDRATDHRRSGDGTRRAARREARALMAEYRARIEGSS